MIKAQRYAYVRMRTYARAVFIRVAAACIREPRKICGTSVKIIQLNEYGCRDAPCEKSWKQGNPLSNTIKDTSTIMCNPSLHSSDKGLRMIVLVSLIVLLRGFPCFHDFRMVHPYIHIHSIE